MDNRKSKFQFPDDRESQLHVTHGTGRNNRFYTCSAVFRLKRTKFISLRTNSFKKTYSSLSCEDISMYMVFSPNTQIFRFRLREKQVHISLCDSPMMYYSKDNQAKIYFRGRNRDVHYNFNITVLPLDKSGDQSLNVAYTTNSSGVITPYGFNGFVGYAGWSRPSSTLVCRGRKYIMLSFPHFHIEKLNGCGGSYLKICSKKKGFWRGCGVLQVPPKVYKPKTHFQFAFQASNARGYSGFAVRFSFHKLPELPEKVQTSDSSAIVFNCSVPNYNEFRQHLHCNLETECLDSKDEDSCTYSRGECDAGFLNEENKCYKYVKTKKTMTWYDAADVCLAQRLKLASFTTLKHFDAFREHILRFAHTTFKVFVGLRTSASSLPSMYRDVWQWSSGIMAYYFREDKQVIKPSCGFFDALSRDKISTALCGNYEHMQFIFCEEDSKNSLNTSLKVNLPPLAVNATFGVERSTRFVTCSEGHVTHDFLSCDHGARCGAELTVTSCVTHNLVKVGTSGKRLEVLIYVCDSQSQTIHYTQVCDHYVHCFDSSDENFCVHRTCPEKQCLSGQCVTTVQWCDGMTHCFDGSDESCSKVVTGYAEQSTSSTSGFHVVLLDGHGKYKYVPQSLDSPVCSQTHFLCANYELCVPVYLRCNGVFDCADQEDEHNCDDVTCQGYYRCQSSTVCVHNDHVCDGVFQCPQQDDELLCHLDCPDNCLCQGLAFVCPLPFQVQNYIDLRYLDSSQSGLPPDRIFHNHYLVWLSLSSCGLYSLPVLEFPNLHFLDLGKNSLTNISMHVFLKLSNLKIISLSRNPLKQLVTPLSGIHLKNVHSVDLSYTKLERLQNEMLYNVRNVRNLNFSHSFLSVINNDGFGSLTKIESLDLRGTELKDYPVNMLKPLSYLRLMFSDVYKLCCPELVPEPLRPQNCHTSVDEIASCKDLLKSDIYRLFLWFVCSIALTGNAVSFLSRIYMQRGKPPNSFNIFIAHLNVADFFMGLYLVIIGSADQIYRGTYLWHDKGWMTGVGCNVAGFFSLLSSEMSVFIICIITLDRFLVMHFPFSQLRFKRTSSETVCWISWLIAIVVATLPLLPVAKQWEFYSQTGICIPLPIIKRNFQGFSYSFGIFIVCNFIFFILIAVGQLSIYISIRDNSMATDKKNEREARVARRLLTVVMSDFLCWFPIGFSGILAYNGVTIPGEVNVAMAIFAMPLNSALNPFLYTFNLLMEKRQKAAERRLLKILQIRNFGQIDQCPGSHAKEELCCSK